MHIISFLQIIYACSVSFYMCLNKVYLDARQAVGKIYPVEGRGQVLLFNLSIYKLYAFSKQRQMLLSEKNIISKTSGFKR